MGVVETVVFLLLCLPVTIFIATVSVLSALGKSIAFRKKYVHALLYIFQYGKKKIEKANKLKYGAYDSSDEEDAEIHQKGILADPNGNRAPPQTQKQTPINKEKTNEANNLKQVNKVKKEEGNNAKENNSAKESKNIKISEEETEGLTSSDLEETEELTISSELPAEFQLSDIFEFTKSGIESIVEDQVTQRFVAEELKSWNLLTRTNRHYEFISWRLSFIWVVGFFIRYFLMLPVRVATCFMGVVFLTMSTALVGCIPQGVYGGLKARLYKVVYLQAFEFLSWSLSALVHHHDLKNRPGVARRSVEGIEIRRGGGICVANHTSPIDVLVLAVDQCYDMVGQSHGGFLGLLQRALARASNHIWFERSEMKDREAVARRLKEHVEDDSKLPILIFPEGTCINNSAVMQFKKGSFEVGGIIYPVAIKYDARFGDPFWDSSNYSMVQYLLMMMSSWAIVCDVWYLPPMIRKRDETAVDFANRVKAAIARKGGLVDLDWDGGLKRAPAKKEWKEQQQLEYSKKFVNPSPTKQINSNSNSNNQQNHTPKTITNTNKT